MQNEKSNNGDKNITVLWRRFEKKTFVTFFYASKRTQYNNFTVHFTRYNTLYD